MYTIYGFLFAFAVIFATGVTGLFVRFFHKREFLPWSALRIAGVLALLDCFIFSALTREIFLPVLAKFFFVATVVKWLVLASKAPFSSILPIVSSRQDMPSKYCASESSFLAAVRNHL